MSERSYYSVRRGRNPLAGRIDLATLLRLMGPLFEGWFAAGYFQEDLGFTCVDTGFNAGKLGHDIEALILINLGKTNLHPIPARMPDFAEHDLFDVIELLYDHCSKPIERHYHNWDNCGWHCSKFDKVAGMSEYRAKVNELLKFYGVGYELAQDGDIQTVPKPGLEPLLDATVPEEDAENVRERIEAARRKFQRYRSTLDERRDAIRDLAAVLEYLRPKAKTVITSKDEKDLFELANNFGIRHHNQRQKINYDQEIWYSWMFYYYLATLHAVLQLLDRPEQEE